MKKKIKSFREVCAICHKLQQSGKKVVFCHGFFDIFHRGHAELLTRAKTLGDILVVGVDHDDNAKIVKGSNRPINDHNSRMFVVACIESVDYVFLIKSLKNIANTQDFYFGKIYRTLKPDIVATSIKAGKYGSLKKKQALKVGATFVDIKKGLYKKRTSYILKHLELE